MTQAVARQRVLVVDDDPTVSEVVGRVPIAFPGGPERVRTLAICSGRPGGIAREAAATGADALLTGEPQEDFRALARELGISIICAGHHATETLGVQAARCNAVIHHQPAGF